MQKQKKSNHGKVSSWFDFRIPKRCKYSYLSWNYLTANAPLIEIYRLHSRLFLILYFIQWIQQLWLLLLQKNVCRWMHLKFNFETFCEPNSRESMQAIERFMMKIIFSSCYFFVCAKDIFLWMNMDKCILLMLRQFTILWYQPEHLLSVLYVLSFKNMRLLCTLAGVAFIRWT